MPRRDHCTRRPPTPALSAIKFTLPLRRVGLSSTLGQATTRSALPPGNGNPCPLIELLSIGVYCLPSFRRRFAAAPAFRGNENPVVLVRRQPVEFGRTRCRDGGCGRRRSFSHRVACPGRARDEEHDSECDKFAHNSDPSQKDQAEIFDILPRIPPH